MEPSLSRVDNPAHYLAMRTAPICVLLCCTLTGCFSIRYESVRSPQISGVISDGGVPLRMVAVTLSAKEFPVSGNGPVPCRAFDEAKTLTDDSGQFSIGPIKKRIAFDALYPPGNYWSVCVTREDGSSLVVLSQFQSVFYQFGRQDDLPVTLRVNCDVSAQVATTIDGRPPILGRCKIANTLP